MTLPGTLLVAEREHLGQLINTLHELAPVLFHASFRFSKLVSEQLGVGASSQDFSVEFADIAHQWTASPEIK